MRAAVALLLVVGLVLGLLYALADRNGEDDDGGEVARASASRSAEDLVTLRGRGVDNPAETAAPPVEAPGTHEEPATEENRYVLRGELVGFDSTRPGDAAVRVFAVVGGWVDRSDEPAAGVAEADGRFVLDLTGLFARNLSLTHVEVYVDHPAYVQGLARVDVTNVRAAGRGEIEARITLRPGLAIAGQVICADREPLPGVDVALFASGPEGPVVGHILPLQPLAHERTDAEGRYRLRVAGPGAYLVVAATEQRRPAGADVTFTSGSEVTLAPLVLEPGATVSGRVLYDGAPVVDAHVEASMAPAAGGLPLDVGDRAVHWAPGPVVRADDWTASDEQGRFRLEGLNPAAYVVRVYGVSGMGFDAVCGLVTHDLVLEVVPPAEDVDVAIEGARLDLHAVCEGAPVEGVGLRLRTPGTSFSGSTDAAGRLRVLLSPGLTYTIEVTQEDYEKDAFEVRAGAVGSVTTQEIALRVAAPRPTLVVTFTGERADALDQTWFRLRALPDGDTWTDHHDVERLSGGVYRLKNLEAGRYALTANPGCGFWEESGYYLQEKREVDVPVEGEGALSIALRLGGRLCIAARNEAGELLDASCTIRDAGGEEQDVMFSTQAESVAMSSSGTLGDLSPATVGPPLTPGAYTIELSMEGYESRTLEVEVRPDETRQVEVRLTAR